MIYGMWLESTDYLDDDNRLTVDSICVTSVVVTAQLGFINSYFFLIFEIYNPYLSPTLSLHPTLLISYSSCHLCLSPSVSIISKLCIPYLSLLM